MAFQTIQAASKGFGTYKITAGAGGIADTSLLSLLLTALGTSTLDTKITGCNLRVVAATTFFWENDGTAASADTLSLGVGDELIVPKNCRETLMEIHIFTTGVTDLRVMLW